MKRNVLFVPMRGGVMLKDKDRPTKTVGASLQGNVIVVHWADGFTPEEVESFARQWWPAATEVRYD